MGHKSLETATQIHRDPFFNGLILVFDDGTVGQGKGLIRNSLVISSSVSIRVRVLDDGSNDAKAELTTSAAFLISSFVFFTVSSGKVPTWHEIAKRNGQISRQKWKQSPKMQEEQSGNEEKESLAVSA